MGSQGPLLLPKELCTPAEESEPAHGRGSGDGCHVCGQQADRALRLAPTKLPAQALSAADTLLAGLRGWPDWLGFSGSQR